MRPAKWVAVVTIRPTISSPVRSRTLRIGFVPLNDCAPIVIAHEKGFFAERGLATSLHRELGWATVRDKIIYRELDVAHALAALPVAATLGLGSVRADCVTGIVLNLNGNAITLSKRLWSAGVRDGHTLREEIARCRHERMMTFGVVNRFSSHQHLLQNWFAAHQIALKDVRIVALPPSQMESNLSRGNLDGFCVGEPWNSVAVKSGNGWIAATSEQIDPHHPEKVLMARADFAEAHQAEYLDLVAALHQACAFCDEPDHVPEIASILARPDYIGIPAELIQAGLSGYGQTDDPHVNRPNDLCIFHRDGANEPSLPRAMWVINMIRATALCEEPSALGHHLARRIFRSDLFELATRTHSTETLHEENKQRTAA